MAHPPGRQNTKRKNTTAQDDHPADWLLPVLSLPDLRAVGQNRQVALEALQRALLCVRRRLFTGIVNREGSVVVRRRLDQLRAVGFLFRMLSSFAGSRPLLNFWFYCI